MATTANVLFRQFILKFPDGRIMYWTCGSGRHCHAASLHWNELLLISSAEGGYVFTSACLSVCLSGVRRITEKVVNGFGRNFLAGYGMAQGPMSSILVTMRITIRIQESEVWNWDQSCIANLHCKKSFSNSIMLAFGRGLCSEYF